MKHLVNLLASLLIVGFFIISCDDRNNENEIKSVDAIKIDSVKIAQETMDIFTVQTIKTYSTYQNGCSGFYGYDYVPDALNRNITAYQYSTNDVCTQSTRVQANQFNFRPEEKGVYTFKFWNGKDSNNNNIWIEKKVVVE